MADGSPIQKMNEITAVLHSLPEEQTRRLHHAMAVSALGPNPQQSLNAVVSLVAADTIAPDAVYSAVLEKLESKLLPAYVIKPPLEKHISQQELQPAMRKFSGFATQLAYDSGFVFDNPGVAAALIRYATVYAAYRAGKAKWNLGGMPIDTNAESLMNIQFDLITALDAQVGSSVNTAVRLSHEVIGKIHRNIDSELAGIGSKELQPGGRKR